MAKLQEKGYLAEEGAVLSLPLETLELPTRVYNALIEGGIETVGDALEKLSVGEGEELLAVPNFGQKSLDELIDRLQEKDYLPDDWAERDGE